MNHAHRVQMSSDEFLAWERKQELRWEFDGVRPVAMNGVTIAHSIINGNLTASLVSRLRGKPCRAHGGALKVQIGAKYRYPDALVTCTDRPVAEDIAANPVVIFEILSKTTERTDRTAKLIEYRTVASVRRYVLLEQDQALLTVFTRTDTGWSIGQLILLDTLDLPEIGIQLPVAELYADLELPASDD